MINAITSDIYKHITKIAILDSKKVFYPLKYVLQKKDINFDDDDAILILPIPEDVKYPSSSKTTDAGVLIDYKIEISINNQDAETQEQLERLYNRKVIVVLYHTHGKIIIGCNEMPLDYLFNDDNTSNPSSDNGFTIICRGNAYFLKVSI